MSFPGFPSKRTKEETQNCFSVSGKIQAVGLDFSKGYYLDSVDNVISEQTGSKFVDCGSVNILQPGEQTFIQVNPVILQTMQVEALDKLLQLIDNLIHL